MDSQCKNITNSSNCITNTLFKLDYIYKQILCTWIHEIFFYLNIKKKTFNI